MPGCALNAFLAQTIGQYDTSSYGAVAPLVAEQDDDSRFIPVPNCRHNFHPDALQPTLEAPARDHVRPILKTSEIGFKRGLILKMGRCGPVFTDLSNDFQNLII